VPTKVYTIVQSQQGWYDCASLQIDEFVARFPPESKLEGISWLNLATKQKMSLLNRNNEQV